MASIDKDIINRMQNPNERAFFVNDFIDLGNHTEITEALKVLVDKQQVISINDDIYALARPSSINGNPVIKCKGGFKFAVLRALQRLNQPWRFCIVTEDYLLKKHNQIPAKLVLRVQSNFNQNFYYKGSPVKLIKDYVPLPPDSPLNEYYTNLNNHLKP